MDNPPEQNDPETPTAQDRRGRINLYYSDWPKEYKKHGHSIGFQNPTNVLCYRNCAFAVLLHLPVLANFLKLHAGNKWCPAYSGKECLICTLAELTKLYWSIDLQTREILDAVERLWNMCANGFWNNEDITQQQDSSEFLTRTFHALRDVGNGDIDEECASSRSNISHMFYVVTQDRHTCRKCGRIDDRETVVDTHIRANIIKPLKRDDPTIEQCIANYLECGVATGRKCETCDEQATWDSHTTIRDAPEVLLVQLNRAVQNPKTLQMVRDPRRISFQEELDLTRHLDIHAQNSGEALQYKLNAVVLHKGHSVHTGHYKCYTVGPKGIWSCLDDMSHTPAQISNLRGALTSHQGGFAPYLLVYTRQPLIREPEIPKAKRTEVSMTDVNLSAIMEVDEGPSQDPQDPHDSSNSTSELILPPPDHPDDIGSFFEIRGRAEEGGFSTDARLGANSGLEPQEVWPGSFQKRWEGQQAKIKVELIMPDTVLTAYLKGVLKKTRRDPTPAPSPGSKPTGITKSKPPSKAGPGKKGAAAK